jgi:hypothetical protein
MNKHRFTQNPLCIGLSGLLALSAVACGEDDGSDDSTGSTSSATVTATAADTDGGTSDSGSAGDGDSSSGDGDASTGDGSTGDGDGDQLDDFSFFLTSLAGMQELSGNENGFGGNLTYDGHVGIEGADHICETLAEMSMPGSSAKQWRAFLSTTTEDAIDRVGTGPWYDRNGRLLADDIAGLLTDRPNGDPALANDLANEWGTPNGYADGSTSQLDNHDTLTASGADGRLVLEASGGPGPGGPGGSEPVSTCQDWTSAAPGQDPPAMGHSWPGMSGTGWLYVGSHGGGCEATVHLVQDGSCADNPEGEGGVGCGGGYGGFYCLALNP